MPIETLTPVLNVSSVVDSIVWFEQLGWERSFTWNEGGMIEAAGLSNDAGPAGFAGICSGKAEIFLCEGGQGRKADAHDSEGMWMSWWISTVDEVNALHAKAVELGMEIAKPPEDEPWNVREFHLRHPDGHTFRCGCGLAN